jgi:hypothetical protein
MVLARPRLDLLEDRSTPASTLLASAGGVIYEREYDGSYVQRARAFESDVPANLAVTGDGVDLRVYVGAGPGGGPRIVEYDRGWHERSSTFVGDPDSRSGVDLLGFARTSIDLRRTGDARVDAALDRIPPLPPVGLDLSTVSIRVYTGAHVTDDPLYAHYAGLTAENGTRYDRATALYSSATDTVLVQSGRTAELYHELGHAVGYRYNDLSESFADAFRDWATGASYIFPTPRPTHPT